MKEIIEYRVVYADKVELLEPKVNELLPIWQPYERPIIEAGVQGVFQAMVRYGGSDVGLRDSTWLPCKVCDSSVGYINGMYRCGSSGCDRYYEGYPTKDAWNEANA